LTRLIGMPQKRIVWLYDGSHWQHPFINAGAASLVAAGHDLCVIDRSKTTQPTFYKHLSSDPQRPDKETPLSHPVSGAAAFVRALRSTLSFRPHIVMATHPSNLVVAWLAASRLRARLVYYPFELYGEEYGDVRSLWKLAETLIMRSRIDALITQNEPRASIYLHERSSRVTPVVVHNYKPARTAPCGGQLREALGLPAGVKIVLYEGSLMEGRCLDRLVRSAAYLPPATRLVFMGKVRHWWVQNIEPLLAEEAIRQRVAVLPPVAHASVLDYIADADVGVIIYDDKVRNNYYCEPGKLSDYVFAGVPVVAPGFPTLSPVVHNYGIGCTFDRLEPVEIAQAIAAVLSTPKAAWAPALARAGAELTWESQAPDFLKAVLG
jgi:glycosyltransferase involved in cell wall biosynthesis